MLLGFGSKGWKLLNILLIVTAQKSLVLAGFRLNKGIHVCKNPLTLQLCDEVSVVTVHAQNSILEKHSHLWLTQEETEVESEVVLSGLLVGTEISYFPTFDTALKSSLAQVCGCGDIFVLLFVWIFIVYRPW